MGRRRLLLIMCVYCLVLVVVVIFKIKIFVCVRWGQLGKERITLYSSTTKQFSTNKIKERLGNQPGFFARIPLFSSETW